MTKKITVVLLFLSASSGLNAQISPVSLDKVNAVIGNEAILESDIDMLYKDMQMQGQLPDENPKCEILKMLMEQKLLVAQAKLDSLGGEAENIGHMIDRKIAGDIAKVGSKEILESYYNKTVEQLREELIDFQTEQSYAQAMTGTIRRKVKVTPGEVSDFFKSIDKDSLPVIPDQYMLYEIVKKPNSEQAVIEVKERLLEIRRRIIDGEKFRTLATLYSEDIQSAKLGGELGLSPLESYVTPIRIALSNMRIGQISKIVESEYGYHILQLLERQEETGLVNYLHILMKPRYTPEDRRIGFSRLDSIVSKVKSDSISFDRAAQYFSDNEKTRAGNGLVVNTNYRTGEIRAYFYKDELNPEDFKAIEHISTGEISDPYVSTDISGNELYKVVLLKEFIPSHKVNLKQDFGYIASIYENKKQMDEIKKWIEKKNKTEYIRVSSKYKYCASIDPTWIFD